MFASSCCRTALSVVVTQCKLVAVGLYNGAMNLFDPTTSRLIGSYNFHKKPIYEMVTYDNFIFTVSQDRKLGIFDLRSWQAVTYKILVAIYSIFCFSCIIMANN